MQVGRPSHWASLEFSFLKNEDRNNAYFLFMKKGEENIY